MSMLDEHLSQLKMITTCNLSKLAKAAKRTRQWLNLMKNDESPISQLKVAHAIQEYIKGEVKKEKNEILKRQQKINQLIKIEANLHRSIKKIVDEKYTDFNNKL